MQHDLRYGGAIIQDEEVEAIVKSVYASRRTGNWQAGEQAKKMEQETAAALGVEHGILTTSGSCAALLALEALELPKGSEVIIPAVTFPTVFNIILQQGFVPVVVDSKVGTYNLDPEELEAAISEKTRAIIAVHAVGNPVDMPRVMEIAKKHNLYVIEDNCDGWGSAINGKPVGSFGDISITSFHAAHIVSMGVGGGVFTDSDILAERIKMYRDWGRQADTDKPNQYPELPADHNPRFIYEKIGYNFQILELQAAMGRVQLKRADAIKKSRQRHANYLIEHLSELPLVMPVSPEGSDVCWFSLPLTCKEPGTRARLVPFLEERGIETRSMFAGNITKHPAYKDAEFRVSGDLAGADQILAESFWITVHPRLRQPDLDFIVSVFNRFYETESS